MCKLRKNSNVFLQPYWCSLATDWFLFLAAKYSCVSLQVPAHVNTVRGVHDMGRLESFLFSETVMSKQPLW